MRTGRVGKSCALANCGTASAKTVARLITMVRIMRTKFLPNCRSLFCGGSIAGVTRIVIFGSIKRAET